MRNDRDIRPLAGYNNCLDEGQAQLQGPAWRTLWTPAAPAV